MGLYSLSDLEYMFWAAIRNGSVGTIGAKGDPGGFTTPTVIGAGVSLDTITTPGLYLNPNANATAGPANASQSTGGHLEVIASANWIIQRYTEISDPRVVYLRHRNSSSTWFPWYAINATRVDQTAGRAIYQWDDLNNREQIIYGDTGWRTVPVPAVAGKVVSGDVLYRRTNSKVSLRFNNVLLDTANTGYCPIILTNDVPTGFKVSSVTSERSMQLVGLAGSALAMQFISIFGEIAWIASMSAGASSSVTRPATALSGSVSWITDDAWPTTLPGTAVGTIPNL